MTAKCLLRRRRCNDDDDDDDDDDGDDELELDTKKAYRDEACKWNQDFVKKIKPELIAKINFCSSNAVEKYKHNQQKTTVFPASFVGTKDENLGTFFRKIFKIAIKSCLSLFIF